MISEKQFKKRISDTVIEIFPIDRILPLETVFSIFSQEYAKTKDRNLFFRDRKFQRLREGYFSIFVALSLNDTSENEHFLLFPSAQDNDVYIAFPKDEKLEGFAFDVKEFTNWSSSFSDFVNEKVIPKIDIYNLIIATYRKIDGNDLKFLIDCLKQKNVTSRVWIVASPTEENDNNEISNVTIIDRNGLVYNKTIDLNKWIDKNKTPVIYQDVVRLISPSNL
jgi:hypothetical protein